MTKPPSSFVLERNIPLALVFTLMAQAAMAVWWASAKDAQDHSRDVRVNELRQNINEDQRYLLDISQRLARMEAHMEDQSVLLHQLIAQKNKK